MKKNILITGASGNLGQALVDKFTQQGDYVIAIYSPGHVIPQPHVSAYEADLTDEKSVQAVVSNIIRDHSSIDAALLTVGGFAMGSLSETNLESVKKMISLNFETTYLVAQNVFSSMVNQGGGRIVMVGARPALQAQAGKSMVAYALSKSLIFKLAELINAEGRDKNIVCSVIVPSTIDTPVNRKAMPDANFNDWVTPAKIAECIAFLVADSGNPLREPILKLYGNA
jgi:NAD(P)-dependent dehydrogenase (short-subunit alcohol dehydrogenase family)